MRAGKIHRVKRRLLKAAVADNLETMRGIPPRGVRPHNRLFRIWLRRSPLLLVPVTLLASTWLATAPTSPTVARDGSPVRMAAFMPPRAALRSDATPRIDSLERIDPAALSLAVRRVVLDAGHGGQDPGATSPQLTEKEVTLDVGRRLRELLEKNGFEVVVTRPNDQTLPLRDRAHLANASASDIFVSIHVNAITQHTASHGVETYYLGPTKDPNLTRLAAAENRGSGYSLADMRKLLDGVYADVRRDESQRLANTVQKELFTGLRTAHPGLENWGVKRAPFLVLVATEMPAVLAEVGCMSNSGEAAMLRKPEYRQQIADALFRGIRAYANESKDAG